MSTIMLWSCAFGAKPSISDTSLLALHFEQVCVLNVSIGQYELLYSPTTKLCVAVPSVTAPQHVEQVSRNDYGGERRAFCFSVVRAAGAGRVYVSTKPLSRLFVGGAPSDYAICMLCRLII